MPFSHAFFPLRPTFDLRICSYIHFKSLVIVDLVLRYMREASYRRKNVFTIEEA